MAISFTNILKDLIVESSRFQVLFDKFVKPKEKGKKGMMPFETLFAIIAADPTSKFPQGMDIDNAKLEDMDKVKIGKYTQWLLKNFTTPNIGLQRDVPSNENAIKQAIKEYQELFLEDLYKVTGDLQKFVTAMRGGLMEDVLNAVTDLKPVAVDKSRWWTLSYSPKSASSRGEMFWSEEEAAIAVGLDERLEEGELYKRAGRIPVHVLFDV